MGLTHKFAPERGRARRSAHAHAVLRHALQSHCAGFPQGWPRLRSASDPAPRLGRRESPTACGGSRARRRTTSGRLHLHRTAASAPVHFPRFPAWSTITATAESPRHGVASRTAVHRLDRGVPRRQILPCDENPNQPRRVIARQQALQIDRAKLHLGAVGHLHARRARYLRLDRRLRGGRVAKQSIRRMSHDSCPILQ